jgi:hypothetical protein
MFPTVRLSYSLHIYIKSGLGITPGTCWDVPQSGHHFLAVWPPPHSIMFRSISHHHVQEPCLLRGHLARLFPSFLLPSPPIFSHFAAFISSAGQKKKINSSLSPSPILIAPSFPPDNPPILLPSPSPIAKRQQLPIFTKNKCRRQIISKNKISP